MDTRTKGSLTALKECLLTLKDTGENGFEGLLAAVLSEICGQPFRVASNGSQRGRDGNSAFDAGATHFEAKLYAGHVPKADVASKLLELSIDDKGQVDTWVCAPLPPLAHSTKNSTGCPWRKWGLPALSGYWPEHTLAPLAVVLARAIETTEQFLKSHSTDKTKLISLRGDLEVIVADHQFTDTSAGLLEVLRGPAQGLGIAKAANRRWFGARTTTH